MLTLPIKRKWFEMIVSGAKPEEYRDPTEYWLKRLKKERCIQNVARNYCGLRLRIRNGYSKTAPSAIITLTKADRGHGCAEWGAEPGKVYIRLHIGKVEVEDGGERGQNEAGRRAD